MKITLSSSYFQKERSVCLSFHIVQPVGIKQASVNVKHMLDVINKHGIFHDKTENSGLWNIFKSLQANNEQAHDLLQFRVIGQSGYEDYINTNLLNSPSTTAPVRRKRLCTFSTTQAEKRRIKQAEMEAKDDILKSL